MTMRYTNPRLLYFTLLYFTKGDEHTAYASFRVQHSFIFTFYSLIPLFFFLIETHDGADEKSM